MRVADVMTRDVLTVVPDTSVQDVARVLWSRGISGVPVVNGAGALVGIVSELDLLVRNANLHIPQYLRVLDIMIPLGSRHEFDEEMRRALGATAADVMTTELFTVGPQTDLADAATLMLEKDVNRLPVVEQGRVVGIISRADFVRLLAQDIPTEA